MAEHAHAAAAAAAAAHTPRHTPPTTARAAAAAAATHNANAASAAAAAGLGPMLQAAMAQYTAAAGTYVRECGPPAHSPGPIPTSLSATSPYVSSGIGAAPMMSFPTLTPRGAAATGVHSASLGLSKPQAQYPAAATAVPHSFTGSMGSSSGGGVSLQHLADSPLSQSVGGPGSAHSPMPQRSPSQQPQQQRPANLSVASTPRGGVGAANATTPRHNPAAAVPPPADQAGSAAMGYPLPDFLRSIYSSSALSLAAFDRLIHDKVRNELGRSKLRRIEVLVGIPYYTELANIHSVLVTLRDVFQRRKQRALVVIMGEYARQDCIQDCISECADIERGEGWEQEGWVSIETMWKPHPKYASKPWTVRALQIMASLCGGTRSNTGAAAGSADTLSPDSASSPSSSSSSAACVGAHLLIMDADIQFNHFELSAQSLVHSLLDPLQAWPEPAPAATNADAQSRNSTQQHIDGPTAAPVSRQCLTLHTEDQPAAATPFPPRSEHMHQPLFPTPLPLSLAGSNASSARGSGLDDDEGEREMHDAAAAQSQAEAEAAADVTFSPVFAVRTPAGYAAASDPSSSSASPQSFLSSLASADPAHLKEPPPPALLVVLNAPRSFFSDDAIVHLVSYLHASMSLGLEIHQSHGGEFSIHRDLNAHLLGLQTVVYDRTYCVEAQLANRAAMVHPQTHPHLFPSIALPAVSSAGSSVGCSVLEVLMKGKWHAKITLGKLLAFENGTGAAAAAAAVNPSYPAPAPPAVAAAAGAAAGSNATAPTASVKVGSRVRIDLVSEKLLNEAVYWSSMGIVSPLQMLQQQQQTQQAPPQSQVFRGAASSGSAGLCFDDLSSSPPSSDDAAPLFAPPVPAPLLHHVGGVRYVPCPDPKAQSLRVLAPTCTRKQMLSSLKSYHQTLLLEHVSPGHIRPESRFVSRFLPLLQQQVVKRSNGSSALSYIVSFERASALESDPWHRSRLSEDQREKFIVFGPREWASYTVELLRMYRDSTRPEQRLAVICAHRLLWLLGCIAFLNDHSHSLWGHMHSTLHQVYRPVFRRAFLAEFMQLPSEQVEAIMRRERMSPEAQQPHPMKTETQTQATNAAQSAAGAAETNPEVPASSATPPSALPPSPLDHPSHPQADLFAQMAGRIAALELKVAQYEAAAAAAAAASPAASFSPAAAAVSSSSSPAPTISPSESLTDDIVNLFAQQQLLQQGTAGVEQRGD